MGCLLHSRQAEGFLVATGSCLEFLLEIKPSCLQTCSEQVCELASSSELAFLQPLGGWRAGSQEKVCSCSRKGLGEVQGGFFAAGSSAAGAVDKPRGNCHLIQSRWVPASPKPPEHLSLLWPVCAGGNCAVFHTRERTAAPPELSASAMELGDNGDSHAPSTHSEPRAVTGS